MLSNTNTKLNKLIVVIVSLFIIGVSFFVNIDDKGEKIVKDSLENAIKVFAVAKGLNAAISLAQGTEITPAGQITITIGEVLDPINDMVEQFSWIMLASITSLGIQKILLNFVTGDIFTIVVVLAIIILNIWMFSRFAHDSKLRNIFFKITIILIFLRFSIPVMSMLNSYVYDTYVKSDYNIEKSQVFIEKSTDKIESITSTKSEDSSILGTISNIFDSDYYTKKKEQYKQIVQNTSDDIINLIIAFTFKTMFFPLIFLFLLYQLLKGIFKIGQ